MPSKTFKRKNTKSKINKSKSLKRNSKSKSLSKKMRGGATNIISSKSSSSKSRSPSSSSPPSLLDLPSELRNVIIDKIDNCTDASNFLLTTKTLTDINTIKNLMKKFFNVYIIQNSDTILKANSNFQVMCKIYSSYSISKETDKDPNTQNLSINSYILYKNVNTDIKSLLLELPLTHIQEKLLLTIYYYCAIYINKNNNPIDMSKFAVDITNVNEKKINALIDNLQNNKNFKSIQDIYSLLLMITNP